LGHTKDLENGICFALTVSV